MTNEPRPTADGGGELLHQQPLSEGNYLLQFELGDLPELTVHEYELRATGSGGLDPDDFTNGIEGFTAKAANYYQSRSNSPVTTADASRRRIYATEKLHSTISIHGYTIEPIHQGETTLEARSYTDDGPLQEFVKQDVKRAVAGRFEVSGIDSIIEPTPQRTANSGLFEAYRKYKCRIRVDADGTVICGVNVAYHLESTFSAAEWVQRGHDIAEVSVEHDTDLYDSARTATVKEVIDMDYDDVLDGPGVPMSEYHEKHVEQDVINSMRAGDPIIADLQYGSGEDSIFPQLLEYCKVIPTFDQLSRVDDTFLDVIHNESRMKPEERFNVVTSFADLLGPTPYFGFDPIPSLRTPGTENTRYGTDRIFDSEVDRLGSTVPVGWNGKDTACTKLRSRSTSSRCTRKMRRRTHGRTYSRCSTSLQTTMRVQRRSIRRPTNSARSSTTPNTRRKRVTTMQR